MRHALPTKIIRRWSCVLGLAVSLGFHVAVTRAEDDGQLLPLTVPAVAASPRASAAAPIYNGSLSTAFPAVVEVGLLSRDGTSVLCSGTLVTPTVVLTAGHCLSFDPIAAAIAVFPDGITEVDHDAFRYAIHPDFHIDESAFADVGILVLVAPVEGVTPLPLASASPAPRTQGTIVGFGDDGFGNALRGPAGTKREGTVRVRQCPRALRKAGIRRGQFEGSICWRPKRHGQDTCQGDSGGPLIVAGSVAGVTSGGFPECPGRVSWDTDVAVFRAWIDAKIAQAATLQP